MGEYLIRVWLDANVSKQFVYKDTIYNITNQAIEKPVYIDIAAPSRSIYATKSWENDMVNAVLDGFVGTDMHMINKVEY